MRAFCGLRVSPGIMPSASYSCCAITRPLPVRFDRTMTGAPGRRRGEQRLERLALGRTTRAPPLSPRIRSLPHPAATSAWPIARLGWMYEYKMST